MSEHNRQEKVALVSGANRGIGFEIASQLSKQGYRVIIGSRSIEAGVMAVKEIGPEMTKSIELDVTKLANVTAARSMIEEEFGRLDVLVNNAGTLLDESVLPSATSMDDLRSTLDVNLIGPWRLCEAFIPGMKKRHYGRIVNLSSAAGSFEELGSSTYAPAYSVSKAALNAMTATLAYELRNDNILINAVCPGWVRTRMGGKNAPRSPAEGADTAVWLAMLPDGGPTGCFFRDRKRISW